MSDEPAIHSRNTLEALQRLEKIILDTLDFRQVIQKICDSVLNELYFIDLSYRLVLLALTSQDLEKLEFVAVSKTPEAEKALQVIKTPLTQIQLPLSDTANILVKTHRDQNLELTPNWSEIFSPTLSPDVVTSAQAAAGIQSTVLVPVVAKGKSLGVLLFGVAKPPEMVENQEKDLIQGFTDIVGLAVENARLYSTLDTTSQQLAVANEQLKELDRLKDEFVSAAAHALRSPMTAIKGYLSMVMEGDGGEVAPKAKEFLQGAYEGNDRLIRLVNHMLDISRIESGRLIFNLAEVQLEEIIQSEVSGLKILSDQKNLQLTYERPPQPLPQVTVDPDRLREVINNLVGNAIKFTEKGSITITHELSGGFISTHLTDTGPGIAPSDLINLFQKFTQARITSGKTGGSGLGLYVSKLIIKEFGGDITVTSQVGQGSVFTFSIPFGQKGVK